MSIVVGKKYLTGILDLGAVRFDWGVLVTCVHPPICCSWIEEKFCSVSPCFFNSFRTALTVAPAPIVTKCYG